jgi:type IV pilus assembly protein PilY1
MRKLVFATSFLYTFLAGQALADDTEIYVGTNEDTSNQANVLLMVDTSGSMDTKVSGSTQTRLQQTKSAIKQILNNLPDNTRVGLGMYNSPGGSILYPVSKLSDQVLVPIKKTITSSTDDAYQKVSGVMALAEDYLKFNNIITSTIKVSNSNDDATQCYTGASFSTSLTHPNFNYDNSCYLYINGFIFRDLGIPRYSKIISADLNVSAYTTQWYNVVDSSITAENSLSPPIFSNSNRILDRSYLTSDTINWRITQWYNTYDYKSPDISSILQRLVDRDAWTKSSAINLITKRPTNNNNTNNFTLNTYNYGSNYAPYLNFSYYDVVNGQSFVGLRFTDIQIPSGTSIKKATLKMKAAANNNSGTVKISTESTNNVAEYTSAASNISSRALSNNAINVNYTNWDTDNNQIFDITSLVQDKVNGTWCGGDSLGFVLQSAEAFQAYSFDSGSDNAPTLEIELNQGVVNNACTRSTTIKQIATSADDGGQASNGNNYLTNQELAMSSTYPYIGLRFTGIPFDSKNINNFAIEDAYIELTSSTNSSGSGSMRINAENSDNAPVLSNSKNSLSSKSLTTNAVTWSFSNSFTSNSTYRSPDISAIIKELMSKPNWTAGNAMTFVIQRSSGTRSFFSNDNSPAKAAKLVIKYKGNSTFYGTTTREYLTNLVEGLSANGNTPLEGSLYESAQYFLGRDAQYGKSRNPSYGTPRYKQMSADNTMTGGTHVYPSGCSPDNPTSTNCTNEKISGTPKYISPMNQSTCEVNSLILLTDGLPTGRDGNDSTYTGGLKDVDGVPLTTRIRELTGKSCSDSWACAGTIVRHLYDNDFNSERGGKQNVFSHMIGFELEGATANLTALANKGGGMYLPVNNNDQLVDALTRIFNNILDVNTTLASPGIAVNQNNRLEHLNDIYYSVFKPSLRTSWQGNLKKYKIDPKTVQIVDANGETAVDPETGFFKTSSTSFWSTDVDGDEATIGGAAGMLALPRTIFTYTGSTAPNNTSLNVTSNVFSTTNAALNKSIFGLDSSVTDAQFQTFLKWGTGIDVNDEDQDTSTTDVRPFLGDPLHSRPILINYNDTTNIVYYSTNDGYLHAVDAETGKEVFSFIPKELLPNLYNHYLDNSGQKIYGLDGSWIALRHDENEDGLISSTGDYIYLYGGMRMGGNNYYALDVTNVSTTSASPKLKWMINPSSNAAYTDLGQTWSEPVITKIKVNGEIKLVLVFAGGYDPAYESTSYDSTIDSLGKQLYIVDAATGQLIWWASNTSSSATTKVTGMNYSIPSKPTVVDLDNDTLADLIYIGDLGGQVIKFSLNNENKGAASLATGKIIAKLGRSDATVSGITNRRKIYEPITVTRVKRNNEKYMAVVTGTGSRSRPLNKEINDALVVFKDKENYYSVTPQPITTPLKMADMYDITTVFNKDTLNTNVTKSVGFKLMMKEPNGVFVGEKILSEQVVYDNKILFSSYVPDAYSTRCFPIEGYSRTYQISLFDGSPTDSDNIKDPSNLKQEDRYSTNTLPGIAAGSKIIYTEDKVIELVNTKAKELGSGGSLGVKRLKWYKESGDEK